MKNIYRFSYALIWLALLVCAVRTQAQATKTDAAQDPVASRVAEATATLLAKDANGVERSIGTGVFVRADGLMLAAYNTVKDAPGLSARLANGEIYRAQLVDFDDRRNVAVLRVPLTATPFISVAIITEWQDVGIELRAVYHAGNAAYVADCGLLSAVSLADDINGAGTGFRVLKFSRALPLTAETRGSVLIDGYGRAVGLVVPVPAAQTANYAVPFYNLAGLVRGVPVMVNPVANLSVAPSAQDLQRATPVYQPSTTPLAAMPQADVPQRPTTALQPAGIGSKVLPETNPAKLLAASKTLYVTSYSNVFKATQLVNELRKKNELTTWNLTLVDDRDVADLIIDVEHVVLTWEFPFTVRHARTGVIITTGKVYAWGGHDGGTLMAGRIISNLTKLRASLPTK